LVLLKQTEKSNIKILFYVNKEKLDITVKLSPPSERESIWQRESFEILRRKYTENQPLENKKEIE